MFLDRNDFLITLLLLLILFHITFGSDMLSSSITFMILRKATPVKETSIILFGIIYKQLRCEKYFYRMFIIAKGNYHVKNPLY